MKHCEGRLNEVFRGCLIPSHTASVFRTFILQINPDGQNSDREIIDNDRYARYCQVSIRITNTDNISNFFFERLKNLPKV